MKQRILLAIPTLAGGGAERVVSILASKFAEMGYETAILLESRVKNEYSIDGRVKIFTFEQEYSRYKGNAFSRALQRMKIYRQIFDTYNPDIVIPFLVGMVREMYFAVKGYKIKYVATLRNNPQKDCNWIYRAMQNYVFAHSAYVFLQTEAQRDYLPRRCRGHVFTVPNPISDFFLNSEKQVDGHREIKRFVSCGRLEIQKNYLMMVESFARAHDRYDGIKLDIYGEGSMRDEIQEAIKAHRAEEYIVLKGRTDNVLSELNNADAFLFSSDFEGMPNALMEAMGVGLPCISTDCPTGPREMIGSNQRGILSPVGDHDSFVKAIEYLIEHPREAEEMGTRAREYIKQNYSSTSIAKKILDNIL